MVTLLHRGSFSLSNVWVDIFKTLSMLRLHLKTQSPVESCHHWKNSYGWVGPSAENSILLLRIALCEGWSLKMHWRMASSHLLTNSPASMAYYARLLFACYSFAQECTFFTKKEFKHCKWFRPKRKVRLTGTWLDRLRLAAADFFLLLVLFALFPALLFEVLLVEFFLFLRLVVGCLVGSAAIEGKKQTQR